jgi:hypothetical protein
MMIAPVVVRFAMVIAGAAMLGPVLGGCRSDAAAEKAAPSTEPERFSFALPESYVKIDLRGEGSESLRAPEGAKVTRSARGFGVDGGADFAVEVVSHGPTLDAVTGVTRVLSESDLSVFKSEQGYSFVVLRELVPEWDDSERQRFACGSAGGVVSGASTSASTRGFSKAAIEHMVAACRTLELPRLE